MSKISDVQTVAENDAVVEVAKSPAELLGDRMLALDASARKQGHSLEAILSKAAQAFFGITLI